MEEPEEVFEDALDEVDAVEEAKEGMCINNNNNNSSKSKLKGFKLSRKGKKGKEKSLDELEDFVSLEEGLIDAQRAIDLFFDNQFEESREVAQRHCDRSIYHALGNGTFPSRSAGASCSIGTGQTISTSLTLRVEYVLVSAPSIFLCLCFLPGLQN